MSHSESAAFEREAISLMFAEIMSRWEAACPSDWGRQSSFDTACRMEVHPEDMLPLFRGAARTSVHVMLNGGAGLQSAPTTCLYKWPADYDLDVARNKGRATRMIDKAAIFTELTRRNEVRRAAQLPLIDVRAEYRKVVELAEWKVLCERHADRVIQQVIVERFKGEIPQSTGGRWAVSILATKRLREMLRLNSR